MRLVRIGCAVWDVLTVADDSGRSLWADLLSADPGDGGAEQMRAALREHIPRNGPPQGRNRGRHLGDGIYEVKEWGVRVLWFYDTGEPVTRHRIICALLCGKENKKRFQQEMRSADNVRKAYVAAKSAGRLEEPKE
jgi:hypothetical protein